MRSSGIDLCSNDWSSSTSSRTKSWWLRSAKSYLWSCYVHRGAPWTSHELDRRSFLFTLINRHQSSNHKNLGFLRLFLKSAICPYLLSQPYGYHAHGRVVLRATSPWWMLSTGRDWLRPVRGHWERDHQTLWTEWQCFWPPSAIHNILWPLSSQVGRTHSQACIRLHARCHRSTTSHWRRSDR